VTSPATACFRAGGTVANSIVDTLGNATIIGNFGRRPYDDSAG